MSIKSSVFSAPTNVMALFHPFTTPAYNEVPGIPIGIDAFSREVVNFDPWLLKDAGIIDSTWGMFLGPKGQGKSASMKILAFRLMLITAGYQIMKTTINDYKPEGKDSEYALFSEACNSVVFKISDMEVNPLESRLFMSADGVPYELGILGVAEMLARFGKKGELDGNEGSALRATIALMLRYNEHFWSVDLFMKLLTSLRVEEIGVYYKDIDTKLNAQLQKRAEQFPAFTEAYEKLRERTYEVNANQDPQEIVAAATRVSKYIETVLKSSYGHMIGTKHSLFEMITQQVVTKDWRGVKGDGETLMRTLENLIKSFAYENNRHDLMAHIELDDEKHKSMDNLEFAKSNSFLSEIARGLRTLNLSATHEFDSLRKGGVGSELYNLGDRVIANNGFFFVGKQRNNPRVLNELRTLLRLTEENTRILPQLPKRHFLMKFGEEEPARVIRMFATPVELEFLGTNAAADYMIDRPSIMKADDLARFAQENGVVLAGAGRAA